MTRSPMTSNRPIRLHRTKKPPKTGIVHLGLGAFFRAHGAVYIQEAMARSGGDWGIVGVSLRSTTVRDKLASQDFLYTALEVSEHGMKAETIDVVANVLVAPEDPGAVLKAMAAEETKIVSLTVTEKGYCRGAGDKALDLEHPAIKHDLSHDHPRSAPGFLARALEMRRRKGLRPFTVLCLDNLPANGRLIRNVVCEFAAQIDRELADWIAREGRFPNTMVDRIVPATTQALVSRVEKETGLYDPAVVSHEPFRQWVVEDDFVDGVQPDLQAVGVQVVEDVKPFEQMKLRMLNGAHSALAYIGALTGFETVSEAMRDPYIDAFLDGIWKHEISPSLQAPPDTDLGEYASTLKSRFRNPEINHLLVQIAADGSQKLPQRILDPLFENLSANRPYHRLLTVVAVWFRYLQARSVRGAEAGICDPMAKELLAVVNNAEGDAELVANLLGIDIIFGGYPTHLIAADLISTLRGIGALTDAGELKRLPT